MPNPVWIFYWPFVLIGAGGRFLERMESMKKSWKTTILLFAIAAVCFTRRSGQPCNCSSTKGELAERKRKI